MSKKIAMIFPGQGSQSIGMGKSFYENSPLAREMFEKAGERIGVDFSKLLFEENTQLDQTEYTQPAILLVSIIAYKLFQEAKPSDAVVFLGHSLGEFSALCASGAIDYVDAVELVHKRGKLMTQACESINAGMMAILGLDDNVVEELCAKANAEGKKVWPANYNQVGQLVVAGIKEDLQAMESVFKEAGAKRALLLNMSIASHCPLLEPAMEPLAEAMASMLNDNFSAPIISNATTNGYSTKDEAIERLKVQLIQPVKYKQSIQAIAGQIDMMIEFGNGAVLKGLNKRNAPDVETVGINDMESLAKVCEAL
ncbi:MAG: [acyl-carrier-protein] S-malonyltransferase [Sulfuricurvum sp. PD_MW2]|jgi:[acyl-carrier-protein] S-malonyltransferase|uniref:ACP S-malonyltransferase n=1 Tax=Sulfuricurvum sp. PD_MW2 TaxID=2027917 RepID=UPI000C065DE3|nr:ACP S-malonyltransferase [Sulfuricurvum sp. PD_MW2]PHM17851.1 MAG: [acyl-carrier-protein] S-malonyltransferase [Sulfuricurvum sp. PD_MW2]